MNTNLVRWRKRFRMCWLRIEQPESLRGRAARNVLLSFLLAFVLAYVALTFDPRTGTVPSLEYLTALGAGREGMWTGVPPVLTLTGIAFPLFIGAVLSQVGRVAWIGQALEAALDLLPGVCLFVGIGIWLMLPALVSQLPWLLAIGLAGGASYLAGYLQEFGKATRTLAYGEAALVAKREALSARARELARLAGRTESGYARRWKAVAWYAAVCCLPAVGVSLVSLGSTGKPIAAWVSFWSALACSVLAALLTVGGLRWSEDRVRSAPYVATSLVSIAVLWLNVLRSLVDIGAFGRDATADIGRPVLEVLASLGLTVMPLLARLPFRRSIFLTATRWANQRDLHRMERDLEEHRTRLAERRQAGLRACSDSAPARPSPRASARVWPRSRRGRTRPRFRSRHL